MTSTEAPASTDLATTDPATTDLSPEVVYDALVDVIDPEIGLDIVTLGLVYDIDIRDGVVEVVFTLTTRGCPMESVVRAGIEQVVSRLPGVREVVPRLVWEPRWDPSRLEGVLP